MPPKQKREEKEETLTRIAIVNEDKWVRGEGMLQQTRCLNLQHGTQFG